MRHHDAIISLILLIPALFSADLTLSGQVSASGVYAVGNGTTAPTVISRVDPEYPEEARKAHSSGTVELSIVVNADGKAEDIKVVKGIGMGLDEKAVEAVQQWRFRPGMNRGEAVRVRAIVEINFRLLPDSVMGDLGSKSFVARDATQLESLKPADNAHIYTEFTLNTRTRTVDVADIRLILDTIDPDKKTFTLTILADGTNTEKKDRIVNQPLQFYMRNALCDVVVNSVDDDQITGYLSVPR